MAWTHGRIPRFHPLITKHNGVVAWWICDGRTKKTEHAPAEPYLEEPCTDEEEAQELCAILNEQNEQDGIDSG